jgi:uncharacterized membrane protein
VTNTNSDQLVDDYLQRLDRELRDLPRSRRRELVDEIAGHIGEGRARLEAGDEVGVLNLLERLGDPADIAAEERARSGAGSRRGGALEIAALVGLLVGGFFFGIGWFVGLVLLWVSEAWTTREKLVGTLLVPGGLLPAFLILTGGVGGYSESCGSTSDPATGVVVEVCTGGPSLAARIAWGVVFLVCVVGPFFTTAFLARRMRRPASAYQPSAGAA